MLCYHYLEIVNKILIQGELSRLLPKTLPQLCYDCCLAINDASTVMINHDCQRYIHN